MQVDLAVILWTDWLGLSLVAYGVASGWVRGIVQQCTRLSVVLIALVVASLGQIPAEWLAEQFDFRPEDSPAAVPLLELGVFLVAVGILTVVRGLVFLWLDGPKGPASRTGGAIAGLFGAALMYLVFLSAVSWAEGPEAIRDSQGYPIAQRMVSALGRLPSPPRPGFLDPDRFPGPSMVEQESEESG